MKTHNFSAGPAILPRTVLEKGAQAVLDYNGSGLSLIEQSHRGKTFIGIMDEARQLPLDLLGLDDSYTTIYLQGGASMQFLMVAYNFLNTKAAYLDTGVWAAKAIKEAKLFGQVDVVGSSKETKYDHIPTDYIVSDDHDYLHITTNNTIYGTEMHHTPKVNVPLIADMSSDIFSRPIDAAKYDLIYAGAQKNLGPAGATLVILKKSLLDRVTRQVPSMLSYKVHVDKESMFNTPPVFAVYICMETMKWIQDNGGLAGMDQRNAAKADLLYNYLDEDNIYTPLAHKDHRSRMNVTWVLKDSSLDAALIEAAAAEGISGIKGHRDLGGFRASLYNALELESVQVLVDVLKAFNAKHG